MTLPGILTKNFSKYQQKITFVFPFLLQLISCHSACSPFGFGVCPVFVHEFNSGTQELGLTRYRLIFFQSQFVDFPG